MKQVFVSRERIQYVWIDSCPRGSLNHFHGAFLLGFPLANHFDLPGFKTVFGISQDLPKDV